MTSQRWMLAACFSLASVVWLGESVTTAETHKYTCKTFGSGVVQPFSGSDYYVDSNCPFTLTRFVHKRVECDIITRRGDSGLLVQVEIIINKVRTVLQNGGILVEEKSVSLPYDHTYQHIFHYGIYTKLRSLLLPLSVTWHNVPGGIDAVWVELEQELITDMTGLCGKYTVPANKQQLITESVLTDDTCITRDPAPRMNRLCREILSHALDCVKAKMQHYLQLCDENIYSYESSQHIGCAFFKEIALQCGHNSYIWKTWRSISKCEEPVCPGDLVYVEQGTPFVASCSNPNPRSSNQELISSCVCPAGKVFNDRADGFHCVTISNCSCTFAGKSYSTGHRRSTKCQSCMCESGKWRCSENFCPPRCIIEGQFVTTFDGKQYAVPGKCTYVASNGLNWKIIIEFSEKAPSLETVTLKLFEDTYTFSNNVVKVNKVEITELHQSDHALVFWQSSMYVQVHTSLGVKIQVQMSPEIQVYITPHINLARTMSGLCGNGNNDTTDDFTSSSGIIENSAQTFAQSWSVGACPVNIPSQCNSADNEIFADEKCSVLNNPAGIFAKCHGHIPTDYYHEACIKRTCNCGTSLQQCFCLALDSYAKACTSLGVVVGDWRKAYNCTVNCPKNQDFSYNVQACNHTCRSLSGHDPRCKLDDVPVDGCGCPEGTYLDQNYICSSKAECFCHYNNGTTPPGSVFIDGRKCICESGKLKCSEDCGCRNGMDCVHCAENTVNTVQKTCDSLSKPKSANNTCESGCYCPQDQYEDHRGQCVSLDNCTCLYSGKVFDAGQRVKSNCKTCTCGQGQWHCKDESCPGKCQVFGNGQYQTFDSKWYRFDGHCQYTLVEDDCGNRDGTFSIRVESVPCCDEALTCSRSVTIELQGAVTLTLSDMKVTRLHHEGWIPWGDSLYNIHTVGLYIVISVPSRGITVIWDKHTWISVELHARWRSQVCGLCGNFDFNEMNDLQIGVSAVASSPLAFGNSWKSATPPCCDVTTEIFPCQRNSYCSAWAQRRCMILTGDTFKDCHLKVDPAPFYHACMQESCSCEFEGKFLGFCTAVAAYAEACSEKDVCVKWRTPDLCPVYCDYYNEQGQCSWHYEACGETLTCGQHNYLTHKLEGCYPRCSKETPYYDENTGECTRLRKCTCYFNDTIIQPGAVVLIGSIECACENGSLVCSRSSPPTTIPVTTGTTEHFTNGTTTTNLTSTEAWSTSLPTTSARIKEITNDSSTTDIWSTLFYHTVIPTNRSTSATSEPPLLSTAIEPTTMTTLIKTEPWSTALPTNSTPLTAVTNVSSTSQNWSEEPSTSSAQTTETSVTTAKTWSTAPPTSSTPITVATTPPPTAATITMTEPWSTATPTNSTPLTAVTNVSTTAENWSEEPSTSSAQTTEASVTTAKTWSTAPPTSSTPITVATTPPPTAATITMTEPLSTAPPTNSTPLTAITNVSTTAENWSEEPLTSSTQTTEASVTTAKTWSTAPPTNSTPITVATTPLPTATTITMTELWSTAPPTNSTPLTVVTNISTTAENSTEAPSTRSTQTTEASVTMAKTWSTPPPTPVTGDTSVSITAEKLDFISEGFTNTTSYTETGPPPTTHICKCKDLKRNKSWTCGEMWTEDCFNKTCIKEKLELIPIVCPEPTIPNCPRNQVTKVSDGCCETWKCDCRCELYGDPHYISFQGVAFDFLDVCTYVLVEEQSPLHHLAIIVDNFYCMPGINDSCVKGITLKYQNNTARLNILPQSFSVEAKMNDLTIEPPYEEEGWKFETTEDKVSIYLQEIRSYVSLSPYWNLVVSLAMEHFHNNTQGQCGVCGTGSCIRKGGQIEDDSCCAKTAYDWVYNDPLKPACAFAPKDVPCRSPTVTPSTFPTCSEIKLCELLYHPVFSNCSRYVNMPIKKENCKFDSCRNGVCSSLQQAADECQRAGFCIDWRSLMNGSCDVQCPKGLVYRACHNKEDDICHGGVLYPGESTDSISGCFCPSGQFRAGTHSKTCVSACPYCKGPLGEPRLPGEVWQSGCNTCTCNNQTRTENCVPNVPKTPVNCSPNAVLVNRSCCGDQICVEKTCSHHGITYKVGDKWKDATSPCMSFSCTTEGVQIETRVCPTENCPEVDRIWDDHHCCFTCNHSCSPKVTSVNVTVDNCTTVMQMPVCQGHCVSEPRVAIDGDLQVEQMCRQCQERSSERRSVTLRCFDLTTRQIAYKHITSCECKA